MVIELICLIAGGAGTYLLMLPDYAAEREDIKKNHETINARQRQAQIENEQRWQRIRAQTEHTLSWMQSAFVTVLDYCEEAVDGMADMLRNIAGIDTQLQQTVQRNAEHASSNARMEELLRTESTGLLDTISGLGQTLQAAQGSEILGLLPEFHRLQEENQQLQQALLMAQCLIKQLQEALTAPQTGAELSSGLRENPGSDAVGHRGLTPGDGGSYG